jgi:hypothetical protein
MIRIDPYFVRQWTSTPGGVILRSIVDFATT